MLRLVLLFLTNQIGKSFSFFLLNSFCVYPHFSCSASSSPPMLLLVLLTLPATLPPIILLLPLFHLPLLQLPLLQLLLRLLQLYLLHFQLLLPFQVPDVGRRARPGNSSSRSQGHQLRHHHQSRSAKHTCHFFLSTRTP